MRITQRTADALVIEEGAGPNKMIGLIFIGLGAGATVIGLAIGQIFVALVGVVLLMFGAKTLLFSRTQTHRFSRPRQVVVIESKGRSGTSLREVPFDSIADIDFENVKGSHYIYYVTRQGERLRSADSFDGSREHTLECFNVAREWLGMKPK